MPKENIIYRAALWPSELNKRQNTN